VEEDGFFFSRLSVGCMVLLKVQKLGFKRLRRIKCLSIKINIECQPFFVVECDHLVDLGHFESLGYIILNISYIGHIPILIFEDLVLIWLHYHPYT
jgi:hypothetical protein